jgi:hypothetical protein
MPDGSLGHPEFEGELLDRARALAEEGDDRGAEVVGERAQLVTLADDENVVGFVVGEGRKVDSYRPYEKSRPFASGCRLAAWSRCGSS